MPIWNCCLHSPPVKDDEIHKTFARPYSRLLLFWMIIFLRSRNFGSNLNLKTSRSLHKLSDPFLLRATFKISQFVFIFNFSATLNLFFRRPIAMFKEKKRFPSLNKLQKDPPVLVAWPDLSEMMFTRQLKVFKCSLYLKTNSALTCSRNL